MPYRAKNEKEVKQLAEKAENSRLRHALSRQVADIFINRMAALEARIGKLERANKKLKGEFKTMLGQTRDIRAEKMTEDMKQVSS